MQEKIWKLRLADTSAVAALQEALKINEVLCRLLVTRGITTFEQAKDFFRPSKELLHDPYLMLGMERAVARIHNAKIHSETILVYGDYDVDGTTSVAIVYDFLNKHIPQPEKQRIHYYIPHRYTEGYGLSFKGIDEAKALGCTLIITLDCGTKAIEKIAYANTLGIDVIVCDHHTPSDTLPAAYALINPKQEGCNYPFKELSACGIGYKLISALAQHWNIAQEATDRYLDLVATSIAADIVPIMGENRVLATLGLERANSNPCQALRALKTLSNFQKKFTITDLVFIISPRINAAGRMDDARKAVALFLAEDEDTAFNIASALQLDNEERKEVDKLTTQEAIEMLEDATTHSKRSTVVFKSSWHKGVVGIVASRLIDRYYKPTIVLTASNGKATGSARSVYGFNIHDAIQQCEDLLDSFGGHFFAAGMTMPLDNVAAFTQKFETVVAQSITPISLQPTIDIDSMLNFDEINYKTFNIIRQMEPFGPSNMKPVFWAKNVKNRNSKIVKDLHVRFDVTQNGKVFTGIGFNLAEKMEIVTAGNFDIAFTIEENEWNGETSLQIRVVDVKAAT